VNKTELFFSLFYAAKKSLTFVGLTFTYTSQFVMYIQYRYHYIISL